MSTAHPLRVLSLEDDPNDAELIHELLEADGVACALWRVDTQSAFHASLEQGCVDLILADYTLPSFDGLSALKLAMALRPDVPFIFVTGTLGEEVAIEALKVGATDYVLKTHLSRLVPSVHRALREAREVADRKRTEQALRRSEAYLAQAQRLSRTGSFGWNITGAEHSWSDETYRIFGYDPGTPPTLELVLARTHPEDRPKVRKVMDDAAGGADGFDVEQRLVMNDGSVKYVRVVANRLPGGEPGGLLFVSAPSPISRRPRLAEKALRRSESYLTEAQRLTHTGSWAWERSYRAKRSTGPRNTTVCLASIRIWGYQPTKPFISASTPRIANGWEQLISKAMLQDHSEYDVEFRILLPKGTVKYIRSIGHPLFDPAGELLEYVGTAMDVTEQRTARNALETAFAEIKTLQDLLYQREYCPARRNRADLHV